MGSALLALIAVFGATGLRVVGEWLLGNRDARGWHVLVASSLVTLVWSFATGTWAFMALALLTAFAAMRGMRRWQDAELDHRREIHRLNNVVLAKELHIAQLEGRI